MALNANEGHIKAANRVYELLKKSGAKHNLSGDEFKVSLPRQKTSEMAVIDIQGLFKPKVLDRFGKKVEKEEGIKFDFTANFDKEWKMQLIFSNLKKQR